MTCTFASSVAALLRSKDPVAWLNAWEAALVSRANSHLGTCANSSVAAAPETAAAQPENHLSVAGVSFDSKFTCQARKSASAQLLITAGQ